MKNPKIEISKIQKRFELSVSPDNPDVSILYLYGFLTDARYWEEDEIIATKEVREQLQAITTPEIHLHINSLGGNAFDGIAIHNLLKSHAAKVTAYVDGVAASAASVILMGADRIIMASNSMLMIHGAWTFAYGNAEEMRKTAETLEKLDSAVSASYRSRFVGSEAELSALLKTDTWLTAPEAKALGLCDEVLEDAPEDPPGDAAEGEPKNAILLKYGFTPQATLTPQPEAKPQAKMLISRCLEAFFNGREETKYHEKP